MHTLNGLTGMNTPTTSASSGQRPAWLVWFHRMGSPRWFYQTTGRWLPALGAVAGLLLVTGIVWGLAFAPPDYQQGNSARIMYIHVPSSILAQSSYMIMASFGVVFLVWRMKLAEIALAAAAPIGASITFLALSTGAIWGIPTWGTAWVWDGRLTSTLILFFLFVGVIALRAAFGNSEAGGRATAWLAIVGVINIPIIKYSVDWWNSLHQPSTFTLTEKPAMPPEMYLPLLVMVLGYYVFFFVLLFMRMRVGVLKSERRSRWVSDLVRQG